MPDDLPPAPPTWEVPADTPPSPVPASPLPAPPQSRRVPRWAKWSIGLGCVVATIVIAGFSLQLPYYAFSPGGTVPLAENITVTGAKTYPDRGDLRLLYVREQGRISPFRWLQASLDPDIDLVKEQQVTGGRPVEELNAEAEADMALAKSSATKVALEAAGQTVTTADGFEVLAVLPSRPAAEVLEQGDVILEADGEPLARIEDLRTAVSRHGRGESVDLKIVHDGKTKDVEVPVALVEGKPAIGVIIGPRYEFPVDVDIDTTGIGGPSAGLAMTLAILDDLTPGNLTGGDRVAVTGTIDGEGNVGEIGAIDQKGVTARKVGAKLFLVPKCTDTRGREMCEADLRRVKERAGDDVDVIPVATLDEALRALEDAGGDPLPRPAA
jgi:PDZ domain-containing protein